jgi:hypothetical protein
VTEGDWVFPSPRTNQPYDSGSLRKKVLRRAAAQAKIQGHIGWHTLRHSYRAWLDQTGVPLGVQQKLMGHATISTTMNVYGGAFMEAKRKANTSVVQRVLLQDRTNRKGRRGDGLAFKVIGPFQTTIDESKFLVTLGLRWLRGGGFEPLTFGLCDLNHLSMRVGLYLHPRGMLANQSLRLPPPFRGLGSVLPYRSRDVGSTDFDE